MKSYELSLYISAYTKSFIKKIKFSLKGLIYFDKYDKRGDYHWEHYYKRKTPFYVKLVDTIVSYVPENSHVLDVGCGDGLIAHRIYEEKKSKVTGIDINPLAVYYARRNNTPNPNKFIEKSISEFNNNHLFDGAVAVEIFEHIEHPELLLSKIKCLIKDGGFLIITTPIADPQRGVARYHYKEYAEDEFLRFLESYGFQTREKEYLYNESDGSRIVIVSCVKQMSFT
ncbi:MAG TPA: class I SAM-dependent methyltransferase [Candidatus Pacearchaeota archaeon]|nr:class I SAM-dependent methyltransferase [Candidatus Pacearchaeota archaeon]